jgi:hypothetical protein
MGGVPRCSGRRNAATVHFTTVWTGRQAGRFARIRDLESADDSDQPTSASNQFSMSALAISSQKTRCSGRDDGVEVVLLSGLKPGPISEATARATPKQIPFGNDNKNGKHNSNRRFPSGMTKRTASTTATADSLRDDNKNGGYYRW